MEPVILRRNIVSFRRILQTETSLSVRQALWRLLADAEADLAAEESAVSDFPYMENRK